MTTIDTQNTTEKPQMPVQRTLREHVKTVLTQYFQQLEDLNVVDLYDLVLGEIEPPLLEVVMKQVGGNQSKAAILLGLNRGTLRKKLKQYQIEAE